MKKILLTLTAVAAFTFATKAQQFGFEKGNFLVEGAIQVGTEDDKNISEKSSSFLIAPKAGYFVTDKIAVGVQLGFGQTKETDYSGASDVYTKENAFGVGAFGRYYFLEVGSRFKAYSELGVGYTTTKVGLTETDDKGLKNNGFGVNGGIGANFFLTEKIALGYQFANVIGFNNSKVDVDGAKASNEFYVNLNSFENFFNSGQFSLTFKF